MTVNELIYQLQAFQGDLEVCIDDATQYLHRYAVPVGFISQAHFGNRKIVVIEGV